LRLHHVAYVCADLGSAARRFAGLCGCAVAGDPVVDANQGCRIQFLSAGGGTQIELLEPLGPGSPAARHLAKGGGPYHVCFEVDDLDCHLRGIIRPGEVRLVKEPAVAPAIGGRRVAFVVNSQGELLEFVERSKDHGNDGLSS
jgi:methylmalonyl-CoA/ethylmalonyl-CoA epimerase